MVTRGAPDPNWAAGIRILGARHSFKCDRDDKGRGLCHRRHEAQGINRLFRPRVLPGGEKEADLEVPVFRCQVFAFPNDLGLAVIGGNRVVEPILDVMAVPDGNLDLRATSVAHDVTGELSTVLDARGADGDLAGRVE